MHKSKPDAVVVYIQRTQYTQCYRTNGFHFFLFRSISFVSQLRDVVTTIWIIIAHSVSRPQRFFLILVRRHDPYEGKLTDGIV